MLVVMATKRFRQDRSHLDDSGWYYRFNGDPRLKDVGLEG
jgi:hypothetical protein